MENLSQSKIIYYLNGEDVQTVALEEIERNLSDSEIESLKDLISSNINWYEAIADAIRKKIEA